MLNFVAIRKGINTTPGTSGEFDSNSNSQLAPDEGENRKQAVVPLIFEEK